jgi:hypothetical protein
VAFATLYADEIESDILALTAHAWSTSTSRPADCCSAVCTSWVGANFPADVLR